MVIVKLIGGIGNQMFQYATARSVAKHHGVPLKLDISGFQVEKGITPRKFELDVFKTNALIASKLEINRIRSFPLKFYSIAERIVPYYKLSYVKEKGFKYDPNLFLTPKSVYIEGYFQSQKYFQNIQTNIRQDFAFKNKPDTINQKWCEQILKTQSVAVHFRRGDYIKDPVTNNYHGICSSDYYHSAIKLVTAKVNNVVLFIFSDDPEWVEQNFKVNSPHFYINHNQDRDYEDLRLMSMCKHHILANSSFSWWGAWLGSSPNQIVVAPKKWFNVDIDTTDLLPSHWIQI